MRQLGQRDLDLRQRDRFFSVGTSAEAETLSDCSEIVVALNAKSLVDIRLHCDAKCLPHRPHHIHVSRVAFCVGVGSGVQRSGNLRVVEQVRPLRR